MCFIRNGKVLLCNYRNWLDDSFYNDEDVIRFWMTKLSKPNYFLSTICTHILGSCTIKYMVKLEYRLYVYLNEIVVLVCCDVLC